MSLRTEQRGLGKESNRDCRCHRSRLIAAQRRCGMHCFRIILPRCQLSGRFSQCHRDLLPLSPCGAPS